MAEIISELQGLDYNFEIAGPRTTAQIATFLASSLVRPLLGPAIFR